MRWRVKKTDGKVYGPVTEEVFRDWMKNKRVAATDLISEEFLNNWRPAREAAEFTAVFPAPAPEAKAAAVPTAKPAPRTAAAGEAAPRAKAAPKLGPGMQVQAEVLVTCPGCGRKWPPSTIICTDCGTNVATGEPAQQQVGTQRSGGRGLPLDIGQYAVAGFWSRFGAYVIDVIILNIIGSFLSGVLAGVMAPILVKISGPDGAGLESGEIDPAAAAGLVGTILTAAFFFWVAGALYYALFWAYKGATPGKMALGLKVVRPDGSYPGILRALGRFLSYIISSLLFYLGFLWMIWDENSQTWHDKICDTYVVSVR